MEASPVDPSEGYTGKAEARYGPIVLGRILRKNLESILLSGGSKFSLYYFRSAADNSYIKEDAQLTVSGSGINVRAT